MGEKSVHLVTLLTSQNIRGEVGLSSFGGGPARNSQQQKNLVGDLPVSNFFPSKHSWKKFSEDFEQVFFD
jgi:hypothetical protein